MQSPHDTLFTFTFRQPFHVTGWLATVLPSPVAAELDWRDLAVFADRFPGVRLRPHLADLVFVTRLRGSEHVVLLLVEHKSHTDTGLRAQLLRYSVHLQRACQSRPGRSPLIVPIVMQHGEREPRRGPDPVPAAMRSVQPRQDVFCDDLRTQVEAGIAARQVTPLVALTMLCLKALSTCSPSDTVTFFQRWQGLLRAVDRAAGPPDAPPLGADAVDAFGWYALAVTDVSAEALSRCFQRILHRDEDTIMSTLERTYQRGKSEGKAEGRAEALLRLLHRRFGDVDEAVAIRVNRATLAELDLWTDRVLDAASLDAVFVDA